MQAKVIFRDGTISMVDASVINALISEGKVAAYESPGGWREVRRMQADPNYRGPERRKYDLFSVPS